VVVWIGGLINALILLMLVMEMYAQAPDPLSGGAGWIGAGLLGLVLGWLLIIRLPANDKQAEAKDRLLREIVEAKDKAIADLIAAHDVQITALVESKDRQYAELLQKKWELIKGLSQDYKDGLKEVTNHCQGEMTRLTTYWQAQMSSVVKAIEDVAERLDLLYQSKREPPRPG
jgi:hypothetical protein